MGKKRKGGNKVNWEPNKKINNKQLGSPNPQKGLSNGDSLFRWLSFELALLKRLVYRNKNQHRSSEFMASICESLRHLKRFTGAIKQKRQSSGPSVPQKEENFNYLLYRSLKSVMDTSVSISRIHSHHFHVPLITAMLSIYGRLLFLLKKLAKLHCGNV